MGGGRLGSEEFLVLDDVGPVFDDPVVAGVLLGECGLQEFGGVVEAELAVRSCATRWRVSAGAVAMRSSSSMRRS
jgi:hypothetical protein